MLMVDRGLVSGVLIAQTGEDLHEFVQSALELEHSVIPPYLTAYYTLRPGRNDEIGAAVRNIAVEEMLHLTIAGNLLVALGGKPRLADPSFVPTYPTLLPMNIGDLTVGLAPYSRQLVHDVFMRIEEPEHPIEFPTRALAAPDAAAFATIGEFYEALISKLVALGDGAFIGDPARQVVDPSWFPPDQLFRIVDVTSARAALTLVVEEGEGTKQSPLDREGELAHYYRFAELWHGYHLVPDTSAPDGYSYMGTPIDFDPGGVWAMPANPRLAQYPAESRSRFIAGQFSLTYTRLLHALHEMFNGAPGNLDAALGIMFELRLLAQDVLATPDTNGQPTGLCFEYASTGG
jgi:hypothetical protein